MPMVSLISVGRTLRDVSCELSCYDWNVCLTLVLIVMKVLILDISTIASCYNCLYFFGRAEGRISFIKERCDGLTCLGHGCIEVIVGDAYIAFVGKRNLVFGFGYALIDGFWVIGTASFETLAQGLYVRRQDEYGEGAIAEVTFDVECSFDVYIEYDVVTGIYGVFDFRSQCAVVSSRVYFLPFDKAVFGYGVLKFVGGQKVIMYAVDFAGTRRAIGGADAEAHVYIARIEYGVDDGGLAAAAGGAYDDNLALFHSGNRFDYITLSTCSLICSRRSFIITTMRCISA